MKLYIKRNEGSNPLGITTKRADSVEWEGGQLPMQKGHSVKIKGTKVADIITLPKSHKTNEFIVWSKEPMDNPYDENSHFGQHWESKREHILKQKKLSEQTIAEIKFDVPAGFFTEKASWSSPKQVSKPTYFETLARKFWDTTTFDDEHGASPMADYIWCRAILKSVSEFRESVFAKNKADINAKPKSRYYIYDESSEKEDDYVKEKPKLEAYAYMYEIQEKWNQEQCYKFTKLIAHKYQKVTKPDRKLTEKRIKSWIMSFISSEASDQNLRLRLFVEVYNRLNNKTLHKITEHEFFIIECIDYKVLLKTSNSPDYFYIVDEVKYPIGSLDTLMKLSDNAILETLKLQLKTKIIES